ncbi:hypothetical protein G7054_g1601 [Neopestalotiopsis clavispora]|nr:hypothetical protein G7054_g1601 [Neopestalotiopsis clavispora]
MPSSIEKPDIVLVQGSFQLPEVYYKLADTLRTAGYTVHQPILPTLTEPDLASKTLSDDALAIQTVVQSLVEVGKRVVVAMHSYGGLVGSEAIVKDLSFDQRQSDGRPGGVAHLFYFAAFILTEGQSVLGVFGESPNNEVKPNGRFTIKNAAEILYNDLPQEEALSWQSKIIDQSYAVQEYKMTNEAYRFIPSTYAVCEDDRGPPPQYQEMFGSTAGSKIIKINSGHSPMLSHTSELAQMIGLVAQ